MADRSSPQRLLHLLCGVAFLAAGGSNPYGTHGCPHHEGPPGSGQPHGAAVADGGAPGVAHGASGPGGPDHHSDEPCTCVGTCHVSAHPPVPGVDAEASPRLGAARNSSSSPARADTLRGPRHRPFELHLPNAPPVSV